jgi:hypothetical protein
MSVGTASQRLVLYVASEPGSYWPELGTGSAGGVPAMFRTSLARLFVPGGGRSSPLPAVPPVAVSDTPDIPADLPPSVEQCVALVLDLARRSGWSVRIVDVTGGPAALEDGTLPPGDGAVFPVLVRPDGARLQGEDQFVPSTVRRFLADRRGFGGR